MVVRWGSTVSSIVFLLQKVSDFNPRSLEEKIVTRTLEGGGSIGSPPSTFDTIHPIDMKFGTHKLHLYFQLTKTMWCLIGFYGNHSQINDVTSGHHLGFLNFQILFKMTRKQYLAIEIHKILGIHCESASI